MSLRACLCVVLVLALAAACDAQCVYSSSHSSLAIDSGTGAPLHGAGGATLKDGFCISANDNDLKCQGQGRKPQKDDCPADNNQLCCGNAYRNSRPLPKPTAPAGTCSFTTYGGAKVQVVRGFCVKDERKECDEFGMSGNIGQGANCPGATTCCELLKKPKVAAPAPAPAAPTTPDAPAAPAAPVRDARAEIRAEFEAMRKKRADAAAAAAAAAAAPAPVVPVFPEGTYCPLPSYKAVSFVELEGDSDSAALLESESEAEAETDAPKLNAAQRAYCEQQRQAWLKSRAAKGDVQAQQALKQAPKSKSTKAKTTKSKSTKATKSTKAKTTKSTKATKSKSKSAKKATQSKAKSAKRTGKKAAKMTSKKAVKKTNKSAAKSNAKKGVKKSAKKSSAKKAGKKTAKKTAKKAGAKKTVKKTAKKAAAKKSSKKSSAKGKAAPASAKRAQCLSKCARLACTKKLPLTSSCKRIIDNCNGTCPSDAKTKAKWAAPKANKAPAKKAAARKTNKAPKKAAARKTNKKAAAPKKTAKGKRKF